MHLSCLRGKGVPCLPNQHITGVSTEENCKGCEKKKSKGKGQGYQREGREEVLVRNGNHARWMERAAQEWDGSCLCAHIAAIWGLNLLYWASEKARAAGAYSVAGHRRAALDIACNATVSWLPGVPCSKGGLEELRDRWSECSLEGGQAAFLLSTILEVSAFWKLVCNFCNTEFGFLL